MYSLILHVGNRWSERSASHSDRFTSEEKAPATRLLVGRTGRFIIIIIIYVTATALKISRVWCDAV
jgi:hypothetical protein